MKSTLDAATATLRLDFEGPEALASYADDWRRKAGCLVRLPEALKLWTPLTVELRHAGVARLVVTSRVVQVFGGGSAGFATALEATEPEALGKAAATGDDVEAAALAPATAPDRGADAPRAPAGGGGETLGASPVFRIREMNVSERIRFAAKASRGERQILLRDGSPQVLMGLLANPRLEDREVLALVKSSSASSGVLQRIAKDRRWSANYEIRLALVKNPQTPTPLALQMLDSLRERDLRILAKAGAVREAIRGAALRKVIKR